MKMDKILLNAKKLKSIVNLMKRMNKWLKNELLIAELCTKRN